MTEEIALKAAYQQHQFASGSLLGSHSCIFILLICI
jgi:hypothetical protein